MEKTVDPDVDGAAIINALPQPIHPMVEHVCRQMMRETGRALDFHTIRGRTLLYSSHGAILWAQRNSSLIIQEAAKLATMEWVHGTRQSAF